MRVQGTHSLRGDTEAQLPAVARLGDTGVGGLTLHCILHILGKQIPHHFSADFTHVQFLGKPGEGHESMKPWQTEGRWHRMLWPSQPQRVVRDRQGIWIQVHS